MTAAGPLTGTATLHRLLPHAVHQSIWAAAPPMRLAASMWSWRRAQGVQQTGQHNIARIEARRMLLFSITFSAYFPIAKRPFVNKFGYPPALLLRNLP